MWKIMNGCECCTNVCNPQDNDTDYDMGIIVSVPGERVPRKRYPVYLRLENKNDEGYVRTYTYVRMQVGLYFFSLNS